jgi:hypothetical protein
MKDFRSHADATTLDRGVRLPRLALETALPM